MFYSLQSESYPWCGGHHSVREDEQIQTDQLEDILEQPDDLQSEHILETRETHGGHHGVTLTLKGPRVQCRTCLQSSPTLKIAACQQTLRDPSGFSSPSSRESDGQRRPSRSSSLTPQRFTLNLARYGALAALWRRRKHVSVRTDLGADEA